MGRWAPTWPRSGRTACATALVSAFEPGSGSLWQTENGDDSWDEINVFEAGSNSGWIQLQGPPERFDQYRQLEVASEDGLDNPSFDPSVLATDATSAETCYGDAVGLRIRRPAPSYSLHPPRGHGHRVRRGRSLGASLAHALWNRATVDLVAATRRHDNGKSLALDGPFSDRVGMIMPRRATSWRKRCPCGQLVSVLSPISTMPPTGRSTSCRSVADR